MKIIVLDFASGIPYVFDFPKECSDAEDFFDTEIAKEYKLREGNCNYMVTNEEIQNKKN